MWGEELIYDDYKSVHWRKKYCKLPIKGCNFHFRFLETLPQFVIHGGLIWGMYIGISVCVCVCIYIYIYIYINKLFQLFSNMQLAILKKIYWNLNNIYLALTQISQFNMPLLVVSFYLCCTAMWTRDVKLSVKLIWIQFLV